MHKHQTAIVRDMLQEVVDGPVTLRISGNCMAPRLTHGARIRVAPTRLYLPGDVLVFAAGDGRLTAHRLLGAYLKHGGMRFVTAADNASSTDAAIPVQQVVGRIVGGDCDSSLCSISLRQRLRSAGHFVRLVINRLALRFSHF